MVSEAVGSAMKCYGNTIPGKQNFLTTAWLISFIARWFKIMCSKSLKLALRQSNLEKYKEVIRFLGEIIDLL